MNIELIVVGKTDMKEVEALVTMYTKRINHYVKFAITTLADVRNTKNLSAAEQKRMSAGTKRLVFVIGGPYGFSDAVYQRANSKLSLSKMTFSHQIVRAIFTEQLYRAFTILKNEPYHHE